MRWIILVLILTGCIDECMEISNANPIKFWPVGTQTFNVKVETGVDRKCYFAPFSCSEPIKVQFKPDEEVNTILPPNEWTPIFGTGFVLPGGDTDEDNFYQFNTSGTTNRSAYMPLVLGIGESVTFRIGASVVTTGFNPATLQATFALMDDSNTDQSSPESISLDPDEADEQTITLTATGAATRLRVTGTMTGEGEGTITPLDDIFLYKLHAEDIEENDLGDVSFTGDEYKNASIVMDSISACGKKVKFLIKKYVNGEFHSNLLNSDYIDVATNSENVYIQYSNENNFSGLDYSLDTIFGTYVKAKFFHERFPEENESEGFSDGSVIKLSGSVKKQKLLQIEPVPYYKHEQLKLILQHNYILIDGQLWEKEENYEMQQLNEKNPFNTGSVWLTLKENSYFTNVYGVV